MNDEDILRRARNIMERRIRYTPIFEKPDAVAQYLKLKMIDAEREVFGVLFLTTRHQLIADEILFMGGVDSCTVVPRIIVQRALHHNSSSIVCYHPHPSGVAEPSSADHAITKRIVDACALIDVRVLDHFVCGANTLTSMASLGML